MKLIIKILLSLLLVLTFSNSVYAFNAYVKYVIDGDTIVLSNGKKVRYLAINAPEIAHYDQKGEPYGKEATERNRQLVEGKIVRLEYGQRKKDRFGRILAFVFLRDGTFVNKQLVEEGYAFVCIVEKNIRHKKELLKAQQEAISEKRGLWAYPVFKKEKYYIGNKKSLRFHRPTCKFGRRTWRGNRVIFKTREEAFLKGYCRCKKCLP